MFGQDIRYGLRLLARSPGFTVVVVLILAVGIAANTAVFSVVNAVMFRPLPYREARRIVTIREQAVPLKEGFRHRPNFFFLRDQNQVFEALAGAWGRSSYVAGIEKPHEVRAFDVTWNLFSVLGVPPVLGRGFQPEDERPQNTRVVVLSYAFWKDCLGGTSDALGRTITLTRSKLDPDATSTQLESESHTIVGVMPRGFDFPFGLSIPFWTPMLQEDSGPARLMPIVPVARLKKGVTLEQADAELTLVASRLRSARPGAPGTRGSISVKRLPDGIMEGHRKLPLLLLGAAGIVMLIACGNAANLFLARATVRQREMALRVVLGASRGRVLRQMLTESLLLSLSAGVLGPLLTFGTLRPLVRLCPADVPRLQGTRVDPTVLGFTLGLSLLTGLLFGMMPAWMASEVRVNEALKEGTGRTTTGLRWRRLHSGLAVTQVALSLILLIGATLLLRSLWALGNTDLGFRPQRVLALHLSLPEAKYPEERHCQAFFQGLLERLRALPDVRSAAVLYGAYSLTSAATGQIHLALPGRTNSEEDNSARWTCISPGFFDTMGIPLLQGRTLTEQDKNEIVIDETLARKYFPDTNPVGQRLVSGGRSERTVLGVVGVTRDFQTLDSTKGVVYSRGEADVGFGMFLIRTDGDPARLVPAVRAQVAAMEKDPVIKTLEPLEAALSRMLAPRRFVMILLSLFAGMALSLAMVGVYGLLQYSTAQQTHDIGIRVALGAERRDILRAVVGRGLRLTLLGVVLGLGGALFLTRVLSSFLYGVGRTDPLTFAGVSLFLIEVALVASYLPARRAARIDPMMALRHE